MSRQNSLPGCRRGLDQGHQDSCYWIVIGDHCNLFWTEIDLHVLLQLPGKETGELFD